MIKHLHITNYALISEVDIEFEKGLNIITGETGAGKSILLGALSLLLGGRADLKAVKNNDRKSIIEATFDTIGFDTLRKLFEEQDVDWYDDVCILRREISPSGRSRAFINDMPVTLMQIQEIARHLVDIHSQHQNMLLADHDYQLSVIDALAGNGQLLANYAEAYNNYRSALRKYTDTRDMITRNQADAEFLSFQLDQLNEMNLRPGEQEELEHDRDVLANMSQIKENLSGAIDAMSQSKYNALDSLAAATEYMQRLSDVLDDAESLCERLESARLEIQDIAETLEAYDADMNADQSTLDDIEERLSKIYSLETKHHVDTSDDLITLRDNIATRLAAIDNADEELDRLHEEAKQAKRTATLIARELSERRHAQAKIFAEELRDRAQPLGMKNLRCEIVFAPGKLTPSGFDTIDFKFAFNKNQPLLSVGAGASGGEISRLILSLKFVIAEKMQLPTIIFDEVDTGVSGDVALKMAKLMANISENSQVIAITHLPQVAAMGNTHFKVFKEDDENSTNSNIEKLDHNGRIDEIATMLSGRSDDTSARATALSLLSNRKK